MLKGRGMEKRRGNMKGRGMVKGDGEGKGLPGPLLLSSHVCPGCVIIGLCRLVVVMCGMVVSLLCIGIASLLGRVASLSSSCVWPCCRCGWSSSSALLCCPCHVVVWCHRPCLATCCRVSE